MLKDKKNSIERQRSTYSFQQRTNHKSYERDVIKKLHKSAKDGRPFDAENCIEVMKSLYHKGDTFMKPDIRHYNSLMNAWIRSNRFNRIYKAEQILEELCQLQRMDAQNHEHLKPTSVSFNICINAWQKTKDTSAGDKVWYLFELMHDMLDKGLMTDKPYYQTYRTVLHALSSNVVKGTTTRAEKVLHLMKSRCDGAVLPDESIYHIVMHIYSHNREMNGPQRVEELLSEMHQEFLKGNVTVKPTTLTFNTVLNTFAKSSQTGAAERAELILEHMQHLHENGYGDCQPDAISFNTVINAYATSDKAGADRRACEILAAMKRNYLAGVTPSAKPNIRTYNACIKACLCGKDYSSQYEKNITIRRAQGLFMELHQQESRIQPDDHTYNWYLKVFHALCDNDLDKIATTKSVFNSCCQRGLLNDCIMDQIRQMIDLHNLGYPFVSSSQGLTSKCVVSDMNWNELTSAEIIRHYLPTSWTCNSVRQRY